MELDPTSDYPLGTRRPDLVTTPSGLRQEDITLEALRARRLDPDDVRASPETIGRQADIARAAGRGPLADNLARAAELASVPTETLLEIYTALRPRRASAADLELWAERLDRDFGAPQTAAFVREARNVYERRGLLALDDRVGTEV